MIKKHTALIVDDSKPLSFFNKIVLERSNLFSSIKVAENGKDAIDLLKTDFIPDIIFLDINMPIMNGWEFLEEYSQISNDFIPVILLLGAALTNSDKKALDKYPMVKGVRAKTLSHDAILKIKKGILDA